MSSWLIPRCVSLLLPAMRHGSIFWPLPCHPLGNFRRWPHGDGRAGDRQGSPDQGSDPCIYFPPGTGKRKNTPPDNKKESRNLQHPRRIASQDPRSINTASCLGNMLKVQRPALSHLPPPGQKDHAQPPPPHLPPISTSKPMSLSKPRHRSQKPEKWTAAGADIPLFTGVP